MHDSPVLRNFAAITPSAAAIQIGVVEDDEGRVAAQFHRALLDRLRGLREQHATDLGRAGEGDLAHRRVRCELAADGACVVAGEHAEHARRHAGALRQFGQRQRRQRRLAGGFDHHRAARRQRRAGLAGDHRGREVPRRDGGTHADGLAQRDDALRLLDARDHVAAHAAGFFGEPAHEAGGVVDLAARFGQRLAFLERDQRGQVVLVLQHQLVPAAQDLAARLGGAAAPGAERGLRSLDRAPRLALAAARQFGEQDAVGRVVQGMTAVRRLRQPLAAEVRGLAPQGGVLQQVLHGRCAFSRDGGRR
jgi:hypothetical protein